MQPKRKPPLGYFQPSYGLILYTYTYIYMYFIFSNNLKTMVMRLRWKVERADEFFRWKSEAGTQKAMTSFKGNEPFTDSK